MTDGDPDDFLVEHLTWIPWAKPLRVTRTDGATGLACRFCVARYGLAGRDVERLFETEEEHAAHLAAFHPSVAKGE